MYYIHLNPKPTGVPTLMMKRMSWRATQLFLWSCLDPLILATCRCAS